MNDRDDTHSKQRRLLLVVHGEGQHEAGTALHALAKGCATSMALVGMDPQTIWVPDREAGDFVNIKRLSSPDSELTLAEVWWGDLSRTREGAWGVLIEIFRIVFSLHDLVRESVAQFAQRHRASTRFADVLRRRLGDVCTLITFLFHGPMLALNCVLLVLSLLLRIRLTALQANLPQGSKPSPFEGSSGSVAMFIILFGSASAILVVWLQRRKKMSLPIRRCLASAAIVLLSLSMFGLVSLSGGADVIKAAISLLPAVRQRALAELKEFAPYVGFMQIALWYTWTAICGVLVLLGVWRLIDRRMPAVESADNAYLSVAVMAWLWALTVPTFWVLATASLLSDIVPWQVLVAQIPMLGVHWTLTLVFALIIGLIFARRQKQLQDSDATSKPPFLAHWSVRIAVGCFPLPSAVILVLQFRDKITGPYVQGLFALTTVAVGTAVLVIPAILSRPTIRDILHAAVDMIGYFRKEGDAYTIRDRILRRITTAVEVLLARERYDTVCVAAHSLGSVLALDALGDDITGERLGQVGGCTFVTMGSPIGVISQGYFSVARSKSRQIPSGISRWFNVYTNNDYIAGEIDFVRSTELAVATSGAPEGNCVQVDREQTSGACRVHNERLGPGGHNGYWSDSRIIRLLRNWEVI